MFCPPSGDPPPTSSPLSLDLKKLVFLVKRKGTKVAHIQTSFVKAGMEKLSAVVLSPPSLHRLLCPPPPGPRPPTGHLGAFSVAPVLKVPPRILTTSRVFQKWLAAIVGAAGCAQRKQQHSCSGGGECSLFLSLI